MSNSGNDAIGNVEAVPDVAEGGLISKFSRLFSWAIRTTFLPMTDATVIRPPGAARLPVLTTVPPIKVKFCPDLTAKSAVLIIAPARSAPNVKELGVPVRDV